MEIEIPALPPEDGGSTTYTVATTPTSPIITTITLPTATLGVLYSATLAAAYGTLPYTWSLLGGSLPPGLTLDPATGEIAGVPGVSGVSAFTVEVTDAQSLTGTANLTLSIPSEPQITNNSLPGSTVGVPYQVALAGSGGSAPYTYAIVAGALPPGLVLASTGGIYGTPTTQGTYAFTVQITDAAAPVGTGLKTLSIVVQPFSAAGTVRSLDECVLVGCADGALYAIEPGLRHDEDYDGNPVGFFQGWSGVPTPGGKMGLNQLGGVTIGAKGNGGINVAVYDDVDTITVLSTAKRPMSLGPKEFTRDFMAKAVPKSARYGISLDNGGEIDTWFEVHIALMWLRPFCNQRKA